MSSPTPIDMVDFTSSSPIIDVEDAVHPPNPPTPQPRIRNLKMPGKKSIIRKEFDDVREVIATTVHADDVHLATRGRYGPAWAALSRKLFNGHRDMNGAL